MRVLGPENVELAIAKCFSGAPTCIRGEDVALSIIQGALSILHKLDWTLRDLYGDLYGIPAYPIIAEFLEITYVEFGKENAWSTFFGM